MGGAVKPAGEAASSNLTRWLSEIVLQDTQPERLKAVGISRNQDVFATPVPFQGATAMKRKVFLAFETDPAYVYVAEGDNLTAMRQVGVIGLEMYMKLKQIVGKSRSVTFAEVFPHYQALPQKTKDKIVAGIVPLAHDYWTSAVPYEQ